MITPQQVDGRVEFAGPTDMAPVRALSALGIGESAVVLGISAEPRSAKRLADMGFVGGSRVDMIRPGRPCLVRVNGMRVGLGLGFQKHILVDSPLQE